MKLKILSILLTVIMMMQVFPASSITHAAENTDVVFAVTASDSMTVQYTKWANNTTNFSYVARNDNSTLFVKEHGGVNYRRYAYIKFSIAECPEDFDEVFFDITLVKSSTSIDETLCIYPVTEEWSSKAWSETYVNSSTARPQLAFVNSLAGQVSIPKNTTDTTYSIDVSEYIKTALAEDKTEVSFKLSMSAVNNTSGAYFLSELSTTDNSGNAITEAQKPRLVFCKAPEIRTVDFYSNGGTAVSGMEVANGDVISQPEVSRENYKLEGWYRLTGSGWTKWDFSEAVTSDMTLTALWQPLTANIFDDFDSHPLDALPIGWTNIGGASEFVPVVADVSGNNMIKLRSAYGGGVSGISKSFDSFSKNIMNVSFDFKTDDRWMDADMQLLDASGTKVCVLKAYHGNFYYTASDGTNTLLGATATGKSYTFSVAVNFRSGTFDASIRSESTTVGSVSGAKLLNSCNEVSAIKFVIDDIYAADDFMYIDNISVSEQELSDSEKIGLDFTDADGNYVFSANVGDAVSVMATADAADLECIIAYYTSDNELDSFNCIPLSFENGVSTVKVSDVTVGNIVAGGRIKIYLFKDFDEADSYCKSKTLKIN